jgi:hypothetical protein
MRIAIDTNVLIDLEQAAVRADVLHSLVALAENSLRYG